MIVCDLLVNGTYISYIRIYHVHVCMYVCMYVYVCMYEHVCMYVYAQVRRVRSMKAGPSTCR